MDTYLLLYTEPPTRLVFKENRPGRLILASDVLTEDDYAVYDQCVQLPPITDLEGTLAVLSQVPADHIVVQTEYGLLPGTLLARQRGLPAPTVEAAGLCTNKWLFRQACHRQAVPVPEFALVETVDQVKKFSQTFPVVLKPIASTLQRFVTKVDNLEELEDHVALLNQKLPDAPDIVRYMQFAETAGLDMGCDPTRQFLVEEFIDAPPLETDGLIFGDEIDLFGVTEQVHTGSPHFFIEGYLFPADGENKFHLDEISRAAIKAIGLTDTGFSIEFRGKYVIEVNGRLGEDEGFPDLFKAAIGEFPILKWIKRDSSKPNVNGFYAVAYQCWYTGGTVLKVPASDQATVLVKPGQYLNAPPHPEMWPHLAYALASHPTSSQEAYKLARAMVDRLQFEIA
jgi:predicted ATP-grasp superfamily ATP-dependent carboligase